MLLNDTMASDRPKKSKTVHNHPMDKELLLYASDKRKVYTLNASASVIWSLCDGSHTVEEIAQVVQEKFESIPPNVLCDVLQTIEKLKIEGLIEQTLDSETQ
jgi:hypothetical protein